MTIFLSLFLKILQWKEILNCLGNSWLYEMNWLIDPELQRKKTTYKPELHNRITIKMYNIRTAEAAGRGQSLSIPFMLCLSTIYLTCQTKFNCP